MTQLPLESHIEALLFYKAEPVSFKKLAEMLKVEEVAIEPAINVLAQQLQNRGLSLIIKDASVALVTNPLVSEGIKQLQKEELSKNLSKAALETLTIVLYRGPIRRSEIDHIRGVNSQFSIRLLLVRGLIEKVSDPKDERSYLYKPSFELLAYLGLQKTEDIQDYTKVNSEIQSFMSSDQETTHDGK